MLRDRAGDVAVVLQDDPQVGPGLGEARLQAHRFLEQRSGLVHPPGAGQRGAQAVHGHPVVVGDLDRPPEQRLAVLPVGEVLHGERGRGDGDERGEGQRRHLQRRAPLHQVRRAEADDPEQADLRHIGVAVGVGLAAHLHETDHRHQRSQVPEPPRERVTDPASVEPDAAGRDHGE